MSDEQRYTPGPWHAEFHEYGGYDCMFSSIEVTANDGEATHICEIDLGHYGQRRNPVERNAEMFPTALANARLISAAPELYEALCDMVSDRDNLSQATIQFALAALAKARGES